MGVALAPRRSARWLAGAVGLVVGAAALGVAADPAAAEASTTTATLSLTGIVDSNCPVAAGGTTVYVAPGGTVDFKATLAGLSLNVLGLTIPLNTSSIASFSYTMVVDGDTAHPHTVTATQDYLLTGVSAGEHAISWTATSVQLLPGIAPLLPLNIPLSAGNTVLPVAAKLAWKGTVNATSATATCGVALAVPSVGATVGPVQVGVPSIGVSLPLPSLGPLLGGSTSSTPPPPPTGGTPTPTPTSSQVPGLSYLPPGESNQDRVMPPGYDNSGDSGLGPNSDLAVLLDPHGAGIGVTPNGPAPQNAVIPGTGDPSAARATTARAVGLATADPPAGERMPVLLAIVAIIALSLVTATYTRLYLLRRS